MCYTPKINCLMTEWTEWSECTCDGGCSRSREREVIRIQSCGGSRCGDTEEIETGCTEPERKSIKFKIIYFSTGKHEKTV